MSDDKEDKPDSQNKIVKIEEEFLKLYPKIFNNVPKEQREDLVRSFISITKYRSSPFPPVEELQEYEKLYQGCTKIIFDSFAAQSAHRINMEATVIPAQQKQSDRGQVFAFIIAILFLAVAGTCIIMGHDAAGGVIGTFDVVAMVTVFITGKVSQRSNLKEKDIPKQSNEPTKAKRASNKTAKRNG